YGRYAHEGGSTNVHLRDFAIGGRRGGRLGARGAAEGQGEREDGASRLPRGSAAGAWWPAVRAVVPGAHCHSPAAAHRPAVSVSVRSSWRVGTGGAHRRSAQGADDLVSADERKCRRAS